jgi:hypothetical protein
MRARSSPARRRHHHLVERGDDQQRLAAIRTDLLAGQRVARDDHAARGAVSQ